MNVADTIIAIGSPPGRSQRTLLRLAGPDAFRLCDIDDPVRGLEPSSLALEHQALPVLRLIAPGPESYTGDDVVELLVPGGRPIVERIRQELDARADRLGIPLRDAGPGEYTARAYLNGRIDLLKAEGISETIRAETDSQLRAAHGLSGGGLGDFAGEIAQEIIRLAGLVEAGIDFTDQEDVVAIPMAELITSVQGLLDPLRDRLNRSITIERLDSVPVVVLVGRPNAGKSSLFNALLGRERTVVADLAGTTRDVLAEPLQIEGDDGALEILLLDGAGFDPSNPNPGGLELAMERRIGEALLRSDLLLRCTAPGEEPIDLEPFMERGSSPRILDVMTKCDLSVDDGRTGLRTSTTSAQGLDALARSIRSSLGGASNVLGADRFALNQRHESVLRRCTDTLEELLVLSRAVDAPPVEFLAARLREALDELGMLIGRVTPDDVLDQVFANFCVGK